jgi:hypothetical protein
VRLAPGRVRLATKPVATGPPPLKKTIGIVEVALFAASTAASPLAATSTLRPARWHDAYFPGRACQSERPAHRSADRRAFRDSAGADPGEVIE